MMNAHIDIQRLVDLVASHPTLIGVALAIASPVAAVAAWVAVREVRADAAAD